MNDDQEMLDIFVEEIQTIRGELSEKVSKLMNGNMKVMDKDSFEGFGQCIDRIYGTAATMCFTEIASYCKALKDVCYMASQSENLKGQKKTLRMMIECVGQLDNIKASIYDPEKVKLFQRTLMIEQKKAEMLNKAEFGSIIRKSCA